MKWQFAANSRRRRQKYVCCNADEGDPGAFMDRSVLEGDPHAVHRGHGHRRLRHRRQPGLHLCPRRVPHRRQAPADGHRVRPGSTACWARTSWAPASTLTWSIRLGAGAFVCGEETALMTSIEGKRGEPRPRPPFPAVKGLFGKPTLLNNVETYANITLDHQQRRGVVRRHGHREVQGHQGVRPGRQDHQHRPGGDPHGHHPARPSSRTSAAASPTARSSRPPRPAAPPAAASLPRSSTPPSTMTT